MVNTIFKDDHEQIIKNRADSYYSQNEGGYKKRVLSYANVGPTNLLTTVEDLSLWIMNFEKQNVGNTAIFQQMQSEVVLNNGEKVYGGFGLYTKNYKGITEIEHGGADAGFRAQMSMFPSQNLAIVVLSNNAHYDPRGFVNQVADLCLYDSYEKEERKLPNKTWNYITLKPKEMQPFVGHYWNRKFGFTRNIYLKNDTLMHFRTENNESWLAPISKNTFKVMDVPPNVIIRFVKQKRRVNNDRNYK